MKPNAEAILNDALSLSSQERALLVHKLLLSLDDEGESPEIEAACRQEAMERCKAFDEGKIEERPAEDVLKEAYRRAK